MGGKTKERLRGESAGTTGSEVPHSVRFCDMLLYAGSLITVVPADAIAWQNFRIMMKLSLFLPVASCHNVNESSNGAKAVLDF